MACNGHCNYCPSHSGYSGPVTPPTWINGADQMHTLDTTMKVQEWHFNWLAWYIDREIDRWGVTVPGWKDLYDRKIYYPYKDTNDLILAQNYKELRNALTTIRPGFTYSYLSDTYLASNKEILDESTDEIRDEIDYLHSLCVCDCNYSCTCNCNYCTCNCNHACQCNCNYSDERLKENIVYI